MSTSPGRRPGNALYLIIAVVLAAVLVWYLVVRDSDPATTAGTTSGEGDDTPAVVEGAETGAASN